jgi:hypothetical protein
MGCGSSLHVVDTDAASGAHGWDAPDVVHRNDFQTINRLRSTRPFYMYLQCTVCGLKHLSLDEACADDRFPMSLADHRDLHAMYLSVRESQVPSLILSKWREAWKRHWMRDILIPLMDRDERWYVLDTIMRQCPVLLEALLRHNEPLYFYLTTTIDSREKEQKDYPVARLEDTWLGHQLAMPWDLADGTESVRFRRGDTLGQLVSYWAQHVAGPVRSDQLSIEGRSSADPCHVFLLHSMAKMMQSCSVLFLPAYSLVTTSDLNVSGLLSAAPRSDTWLEIWLSRILWSRDPIAQRHDERNLERTRQFYLACWTRLPWFAACVQAACDRRQVVAEWDPLATCVHGKLVAAMCHARQGVACIRQYMPLTAMEDMLLPDINQVALSDADSEDHEWRREALLQVGYINDEVYDYLETVDACLSEEGIVTDLLAVDDSVPHPCVVSLAVLCFMTSTISS